MSNFDVKKFVAIIAFHDALRNKYFDMTEAQVKKVEIMKQIYKDSILGNTETEILYESSVENLPVACLFCYRQSIVDNKHVNIALQLMVAEKEADLQWN